MKYLKSVFTRKQNRFLLAAFVCAFVGLILTVICVKVTGKQTAQNLASRWSNEKDCSQVSVFFSRYAGFETSAIQNMEYEIKGQLIEDSLTAKNENARNFVYAYCANGRATIDSGRNSITANAICVGGDYFLFHPLKLVNGSYFDNTAKEDYVIIDRDIAWQLFGSNDVIGLNVEINGKFHVICGVIEREEGRINDLAGNGVPTMYVPYESLAETGSADYINTYEVLLPNPISGYATNVIEKKLYIDEDSYELVENTGRFSWVKLLKNVKNFGIRGMNSKAIIYPYWENVARGIEDYLTPVCVVAVLAYAFAAVVIIVLIIRMWQKRTIRFKTIKNFVENVIERRREKRKLRKKGKTNEEK